MSKIHPLERIVEKGNCMGCGFCAASFKNSDKNVDVEMKYKKNADFICPVVKNWNPKKDKGKYIYPCENLDMTKLSKQVFNKLPDDYLMGIYKKLRVSYSTNEKTRKNAASGGLIPEILKFLFEKDMIDSAYVLHPGSNPYKAEGILIKNISELPKIQGSVYHPTNYGHNLKKLINGKDRFALVGLPCHIEGLEMLKENNEDLSKRHCLSIGLFCGGVNTFGGVDYYLNSFDLSFKNLKSISYREGNWPGNIKAVDKRGNKKIIPRIKGNSRFNILKYMIAFQGYWMLKRCRLCPDQINDFADIAVGDPHLPRYKNVDSHGYSIVITRTERGEKIISNIENLKRITSENLSREDLIKSQGYTLDNRRHSLAYLKVNKLFDGKNPNFTYYPQVEKNLKFRHYKYAFVDLFKIYLPKNKFIKKLYVPIQVFEYIFITLVPSTILERVKKVITNK